MTPDTQLNIELQSHTTQNLTSPTPKDVLCSHTPLITPVTSKPRSYIEKASFLSRLHFFFGIKIIRLINSLNRPLSEDDLDPVGHNEDCETLENLFEKYYSQSRTIYPHQWNAISLTIFKIFKKDVFSQAIWQLIFAGSRILLTYFLHLSLISVRDPTKSVGSAYPPAVGMFLCFLISIYSFHQFGFNGAYVVNKIKVGLLGMMFKKVNRLSLLSIHRLNFGRLITIAANDLNNLENIHFVVSIAIAPLILAGGTAVLYYFWGPSCFVGIGYMILTYVPQKIISDTTVQYRIQRAVRADDRIKLLSQALEAIHLLKIQAWEFSYINSISKVRAEEINAIKKYSFLDSISRATVFSSHWIAAFLIFLTYTELGGQIKPPRIFPTILLMTFIRQTCMIHVFVGLTFISQMKALFKKIMSVMDLPEAHRYYKVYNPVNPENSVEFSNFTGFWISRDLDQQTLAKMPFEPLSSSQVQELESHVYPAISNITLQVKKGNLVIVVGRVGSGKSSLLLSFSQEMPKSTGELRYTGNYEYLAQMPLVFRGTIKDNIIRDKPFDEQFFWEVVEACCLNDEIQNFPNKEMTQVGEKGANLSGSQRIQIGLARSIYSKADIYLLDDPLSGLDMKLAKRIFKRVIQGVIKDATVVLATHQLYFLKYASQIVVMEAGKIAAQGNHEEITNQDIEHIIKIETKVEPRSNVTARGKGSYISDALGDTIEERIESTFDLLDKDEGLYLEEERLDDGRVTLKVYWRYFRSIFNWTNFIPALLLFVGAEAVGWQFMIRMQEWALGGYSNSVAYSIIGSVACGSLVIHLVKFLLYYRSALNGSSNLHRSMLNGIIFSPLSFFIRNRLGTILNRFSNDMGLLDGMLMTAFLEVMEGFCFFMVFLIALWVYELWILIPSAIALLFFVIIFIWCDKTINQTRGLELTTRGPLYSFFAVVVAGLTTLRARNQTENIIRTFRKRANAHSKANLAYRASIRLMSFLIDYVTELTIIAAFCFFIRAKETPLSSGPFVNMLIQLPMTMQWLLRNFAMLHSLMASSARVINYCEHNQEEGFLKANSNKISVGKWPNEGEIEMENVRMRYSDKSRFVLRNLSLHIQPGEKVGVVGGPSAGLSSLAHILLRIYDIEKSTSGNSYIRIHGIDIENLGLHQLRKSIAVIPQKTYVVVNTIRENLDPQKEYTDSELWEALETVGLKEFVGGLKHKMNTVISRGSSVFSAGQLELFGMARAVLRKANILIQDKATVHVDITTDQVVQKNIEKRFSNATVLSTTNRLWNISEYDKVLCLKNGSRVEFDEPYRLLVYDVGDRDITNFKGYFAKLVRSLNPRLARQVFNECMNKYCEKHNLTFHLEKPIRSINIILKDHSLNEIHDYETAPTKGSKEDEEAHTIHKNLEFPPISKASLSFTGVDGVVNHSSAPVASLLLEENKNHPDVDLI